MNKVVFLDRDGTINIDHGYVGTTDKWEFCEGAIDGMKILQEAGFVLAIVTNQSGIARKYYSVEDMQKLHEHMETQLEKHGIHIAHIAFCPHDRDSDCRCRKPNIGMIEEAVEVIGDVDYTSSWTIGDKEADIKMGKTAGTKTALIYSQYWTEDKLATKADIVVDSLHEAAQYITAHES